MEYEKHELEVVLFDNSEIFAGIGYASDNDGDDGGTGLHSVGSSDM